MSAPKRVAETAKPHIRLSGKKFFHSAQQEGIQTMTVYDSPMPRRVVVWVAGRWAYQLTNVEYR